MVTHCIALTRQGIGVATQHTDSMWRMHEYPSRLPFTCLAAPAWAGTKDSLDTLVAGTHGEGVWRSDDGGQSWQPFALPGVIIKSITVTPLRILVGTKNPPLIYSSADRGETWTELTGFRAIPSRPYWFSPAEKPYTAYVQGLDHAPGDPDTLVAGIEAGAVVASQDGGATWGDHRPGAMRDCHAIGYHPHEPAYAYAVGGNNQGAAMSRDGGNHWVDCRAGLAHRYAWAFAADPRAPERWYIAAAPGPRQAHGDTGNAQAHIYRRIVTDAPKDSSANSPADSPTDDAPPNSTTPALAGAPTTKGWEQLRGGLPDPLPSMPYSLLASIENPGVLYAGLRNGQVYRGSRHGDDWELLPFRFDGIRRTLLVHEARRF